MRGKGHLCPYKTSLVRRWARPEKRQSNLRLQTFRPASNRWASGGGIH